MTKNLISFLCDHESRKELAIPETITIAPSELRRLVKAAVTEAFQEQRAVLHDMVVDAIEDIGLAKAMDKANGEPTFMDKEFFAILDSKK